MREGDEIPRINPLFSLTVLHLYVMSSVAAANAFCGGHPTRMLMGVASIARAIMKRLIESFLHKKWTNISVVKLSSTEAGVVKCCEDKWNDVAMGLHESARSQDARETVNENTCKPLRIARGVVTNAVKTLPYAFSSALAVLHKIRVVTILPRMMILV
jgi:hypothetical protein